MKKAKYVYLQKKKLSQKFQNGNNKKNPPSFVLGQEILYCCALRFPSGDFYCLHEKKIEYNDNNDKLCL